MSLSKDLMRNFADFIALHLGIEYGETNYYQLESRILELVKQLGLDSAEVLYRDMKTDTRIRERFLDVATNNETLFFRDPPMYTALEQAILRWSPKLSERAAPLRIWSAACSYGQEVYSVCMMLEKVSHLLPLGGYEIIATDVSNRALQHASQAHYNDLQVHRGLDETQLQRFFHKGSNPDFPWEIAADLKRHVRFQYLNLLESFHALGSFDIILCRNVLIYQSTESKKNILKKLHATLAAQGLLILGSAESLIGLNDDFSVIRSDHATLYQKNVPLDKAS